LPGCCAASQIPRVRILAGLLLAGVIALAARRARMLARSGAWAATALGTIAVAAGWSWAALLIAFFVASSLLSRVRAADRAARTDDIVAKGDERDAVQVLANGGVFGLAALGFVLWPGAAWLAAGAGAIAAATADTWSTEIGTLSPRPPRSILTLQPVPAGTSGGVTLLGFFGAALGAGFIELVALALRWPATIAAASLAAGIAGAVADSVLGAAVQERRWCDACGKATERRMHGCGAATRRTGGIAGLDNDVVNVLCTMAGALVGALLAGA
jgi:uncharacterized protein (TIGR00297 family)